MKNTLEDMTNHLFEQMERLNNEDLTDEELGKEINRAGAMADIASQIIQSGKLSLQAFEMGVVHKSPKLLEAKSDAEIH